MMASSGQTWTTSAFIALLSAPNPPTQYNITLEERNVGAILVQTDQAFTPTIALQRFSATRVLNNGSTNNVTQSIGFSVTNGASYDFTIRIGWPQMETGSVATSPIVTTAGTASRVADANQLSSATSLIGQTEGTIYAEVNLSNLAIKSIIALDSGSTADYIAISRIATGVFRVAIKTALGSNVNIISSSALTASGIYKIAAAYKNGDYAFYINGVSVGTSANNTDFPTSLTRISIGDASYGYLNDHIRAVALFPTRLPNATLASLTA
jgi:hypothetical protein